MWELPTRWIVSRAKRAESAARLRDPCCSSARYAALSGDSIAASHARASGQGTVPDESPNDGSNVRSSARSEYERSRTRARGWSHQGRVESRRAGMVPPGRGRRAPDGDVEGIAGGALGAQGDRPVGAQGSGLTVDGVVGGG